MSKARIDQPFTMVPNICFDKYMSELTPNEFKVYMLVMRKTVGWHKPSDEISLSQFKKFVNSSIPTIRKAIKSLRTKGFVKQVIAGNSYRYSILKPAKVYNNVKQNGSDDKRNLQGEGKESYNETCKNFTTQKKEQKKKLNNNMIDRSKFRSEVPSDEIYSVIEFWNSHFKGKIDRDNSSWFDRVSEVLCYFSVEELQRAMKNRPNLDLYQTKYSYLLHKPNAFFNHLETIENDLKGDESNIYTYDQMLSMVTDFGNTLTQDDFERIEYLKDEQGLSKWKRRNV